MYTKNNTYRTHHIDVVQQSILLYARILFYQTFIVYALVPYAATHAIHTKI